MVEALVRTELQKGLAGVRQDTVDAGQLQRTQAEAGPVEAPLLPAPRPSPQKDATDHSDDPL
jgi:hypothetical protein